MHARRSRPHELVSSFSVQPNNFKLSPRAGLLLPWGSLFELFSDMQPFSQIPFQEVNEQKEELRGESDLFIVKLIPGLYPR